MSGARMFTRLGSQFALVHDPTSHLDCAAGRTGLLYSQMAKVARQPLTLSDITRLTMLHTCSDPNMLAQMILASAGVDTENDPNGGSCCKELLEFCKQEGIDPMPAIKKALEPSPLEKAIRSKGTITGGSAIRVPFAY